MEGEGLLSQIGISAGIVPRVAEEIFAAAERPDSAARELTVKLAVCEVYQEKIRCLFDPTKDNLQLKDDPLEGTVVAGVTEVHVQTLAELMHLLQVGPMRSPATRLRAFTSSCFIFVTKMAEELIGKGSSCVVLGAGCTGEPGHRRNQ